MYRRQILPIKNIILTHNLYCYDCCRPIGSWYESESRNGVTSFCPFCRNDLKIIPKTKAIRYTRTEIQANERLFHQYFAQKNPMPYVKLFLNMRETWEIEPS